MQSSFWGGAATLACSNAALDPDSGLAKVEVKSAVWSAAENPGSYTFWFSPTEGLGDVKAMTLADDYIKVVVKELGESISLNSEDALLSYGKYNVQASTLAGFASAELSVVLPSENTVKLSVRVEGADGEGFASDFHGFCTKCPVEQEPARTLRFFAYCAPDILREATLYVSGIEKTAKERTDVMALLLKILARCLDAAVP